ncbi:tyrosine-type recombinase/integrase [Candidatus Halocynthiibacter alkanivorans]|uniref:tyrosine-type recombinase/integrase n=1 Tax=Candidatus Halocynthiibacter alkanivorans TaxID=2267619 RepID=UPI000DF27594|nr:site-specific integrase [Candidatus Halocynthiibacter alkanivorans]
MAASDVLPKKHLTAAFVKTVKTPGKYHDRFGTGLYLRVEPNQSRFWVQRITIRGKRRELGLGSPPTVPLSDARDAALENKRFSRDGGDPLQAKRQTKAVLTFEEAARKVHEIHKPTWRNKKHAAQFISTMQTYCFPLIGAQRVSEINSADVLKVLTPIWTEKPETARRVRQRIGTILKWAIAQGWRQDNPAETVTQALPKHERIQAHRKALPYAEVGKCIEASRASRAGKTTILALEFLILTASRSGETRNARWADFDLHGATDVASALSATWVIPAERMKAKKAHKVPLSNRALEILKEAEQFDDKSGLVFPGIRYGKTLSDMTLSKLVKSLGFDADVHGFRTSFRTWAQEQTDYSREVAEAALAHSIKDKSEAAYARSDLFEKRRKLMSDWAEFLRPQNTNME